jgi:hypothetical protein
MSLTWEPSKGSQTSRTLAPAGKARLRLRDHGNPQRVPRPPALWLRRAKPACAYAIMGTLKGFPDLPHSGSGGQSPPAPTRSWEPSKGSQTSRTLAPAGKARLRLRDHGNPQRVPRPPALWLRRAKPACAYAIMGTLKGFPDLPHSGSGGQSPPAPTRLDVEVAHVERILRDELAARLN